MLVNTPSAIVLESIPTSLTRSDQIRRAPAEKTIRRGALSKVREVRAKEGEFPSMGTRRTPNPDPCHYRVDDTKRTQENTMKFHGIKCENPSSNVKSIKLFLNVSVTTSQQICFDRLQTCGSDLEINKTR